MFPLGLVDRVFRYVLGHGYFLIVVLGFLLHCWIRILRILHPELGLKYVHGLEIVVRLAVALPSLLERQGWSLLMGLVQGQGLL